MAAEGQFPLLDGVLKWTLQGVEQIGLEGIHLGVRAGHSGGGQCAYQ